MSKEALKSDQKSHFAKVFYTSGIETSKRDGSSCVAVSEMSTSYQADILFVIIHSWYLFIIFERSFPRATYVNAFDF